MIVAELFYPRELKGIIAELRAKGDLNEEVLLRLSREILRVKAWYLLLAVLCLSTQSYLASSVSYITLASGVMFFLLPVTRIN
ncbi:MAG: hypothetical protein ACRBDI_02370 [Alphaproteobacteria bacterium]